MLLMGASSGGQAAQQLVDQYQLLGQASGQPPTARTGSREISDPNDSGGNGGPRRDGCDDGLPAEGTEMLEELNGRLSDALTSLARERVARVAAEATDVGDVYTAYQADRASLTQALKTVQVSDAPYLPALAHAPLGP
jgi:hypothetical protein